MEIVPFHNCTFTVFDAVPTGMNFKDIFSNYLCAGWRQTMENLEIMTLSVMEIISWKNSYGIINFC